MRSDPLDCYYFVCIEVIILGQLNASPQSESKICSNALFFFFLHKRQGKRNYKIKKEDACMHVKNAQE